MLFVLKEIYNLLLIKTSYKINVLYFQKVTKWMRRIFVIVLNNYIFKSFKKYKIKHKILKNKLIKRR